MSMQVGVDARIFLGLAFVPNVYQLEHTLFMACDSEQQVGYIHTDARTIS